MVPYKNTRRHLAQKCPKIDEKIPGTIKYPRTILSLKNGAVLEEIEGVAKRYSDSL